ncbi:helix-turn-helix domain-containing protein [Deinococcus yunweiensis]|uniref:helix-turn-helix domain-containing protein n=1 Tax=Deinococcus yunweiensis TaxID=367282 RepID=UPI00398E3566
MTDTDIRHVTPAGFNLFADLGFDAEEAQRLDTALRAEIDNAQRLKRQLMDELSAWIEQSHLKQAQAAEILMVSRPRVSDVVNRKDGKFTIDALVQMLSRTGRTVQLSVQVARL